MRRRSRRGSIRSWAIAAQNGSVTRIHGDLVEIAGGPRMKLHFLVGPQFGIKGPGWLSDPQWAVRALVIMSLWSVGGNVIIYLAGLQGVPTDLYDAAKVDGATAWQRFRHVTLPMTTPVIFYNLILGLIGTFQYFTEVYVLTNGSGNPARSTLSRSR